ncbi:hypothetical protein Taro_055575 [Colocasia esculenta]|uniref:Uncharacterized protein n=1 Tax=Colocasia esculenta TaxID=4460 RepID=A0A843XTQ1_COLES|nr:hypothetical protein [Colocasia esculenta]
MLSLASGPRPVFHLRLTLEVEKGLHEDRLETTTRSTHRTETLSTTWLTDGGPPHAGHLDKASLYVQVTNRNRSTVTQREYRR